MHRARTIVNQLVSPNGQKFAGWLLAKNGPTVNVCASCRNYNVPVASEPFLNGSSSQYVEDMYNAWLADPNSVHSVSKIVFLPKNWNVYMGVHIPESFQYFCSFYNSFQSINLG